MKIPGKIEEGSLAAAQQMRQRERFRGAAEAFEGLLMQSLLKTMREAQLEDGFFGKEAAASNYESMFDSELSNLLSSGSPFGIGKALESEWAGRLDAVAAAERALSSKVPYEAETIAKASRESGVSSGFGWRHDPFDRTHRFHDGVDLPAPTGTPVVAVAPGRVVEVGRRGGYGLEVVVEHGAGWQTRYAHLSETRVEPGEKVERGAVLGDVGSTGRSTGPHLHFEAVRHGKSVDPAQAAPGSLRPQVLREDADE